MSREVKDAEMRGGKLFIGNLRKDVEKEDLREIFDQYNHFYLLF